VSAKNIEIIADDIQKRIYTLRNLPGKTMNPIIVASWNPNAFVKFIVRSYFFAST
jgi:hypothetical protein